MMELQILGMKIFLHIGLFFFPYTIKGIFSLQFLSNNFFSFLQASLGTTKYCSYFLKNMQCPKPDCMYLHELGDEAASFTKEEMQVSVMNGKHIKCSMYIFYCM